MVIGTKKYLKIYLIIVLIFFLIFIYFFDNIKGQYRFLQYCKNEGGLRIYEPLERNVGWMVDDYYEAKSLFILDYVGFIRYKDFSDGEEVYDLLYIGGNRERESSYKKEAFDPSKEIAYIWNVDSFEVDGEIRLRKTSFEISDRNKGELLARYNWFTYSQFDQSKYFFSAPSYVSCFKNSDFKSEMNSIFRN